MKRILTLILTLTLLCALLLPEAGAVSAQSESPSSAASAPQTDAAALPQSPAAIVPQSAAASLAEIGVLRGNGVDFALDRAPTRLEAAVMLVRLLGAENEAITQFSEEITTNPFSDVPDWGVPYVAWLYAQNLTRGTSAATFSPSSNCRTKDYIVFILRALGYSEASEDFTSETALSLAESCGFYTSSLFPQNFKRGDLATLTYVSLFSKVKGSSTETLLNSLVKKGAITSSAAQKLQNQYQSGGIRLSSEGVLFNFAKWKSVFDELSLSASILQEEVPIDLQLTQKGEYFLVSNEALQTLVSSWSKEYSFKNVPYIFDSYVKGKTEIDFLRCDYQIDEPAAIHDIMNTIMSGESAAIDIPLTAFRNGRPFSLGSTYVEVDFDNQQLTFFKNGKMVLNSNIVTGKLDGHQTPTGLYYSHNKLTNCTLVGSDFRVFVKYWISIIGNVYGFHDSSWRSVFGGDYYVNDGSHGCINTPDDAMRYLFENLDDGTPVLMYGRNTWYDVKDPTASPATKNPLRGQTAK